jgi:uncharacterized glyoxalase superfamily protein PhnB
MLTPTTRSVEAGADIIVEPIDQPYGIREYGARDPEGQLWFFHSNRRQPGPRARTRPG